MFFIKVTSIFPEHPAPSSSSPSEQQIIHSSLNKLHTLYSVKQKCYWSKLEGKINKQYSEQQNMCMCFSYMDQPT